MPPGRLPTLRRGASHITFAWRGRLGFQLGATTRTLTQPACVSRLLAGLASTASVKIDLVNVGNHISSKHACRRTALCAPVQLTLSLRSSVPALRNAFLDACCANCVNVESRCIAAQLTLSQAAAKAAAAEAMEEEEEEAELMEEEAMGGGSGTGSSSGAGQKRPAPPAANRSKTSGAAKRRTAILAAEAAAAPPSLHDLILLALPTFTKGRTFYRSMLRAKVQQVDPAKTLKRKFGDTDEWRLLLRQLQDAGTLSYDETRDETVVPADA